MCGELAGAAAEKARLVGVLKARTLPSRAASRNLSDRVHSDRVRGCSLHHYLKY